MYRNNDAKSYRQKYIEPDPNSASVNEARYLTFLIGNISNHDNSKCYLLNRFQKDVFY